MFYFKAVNSSFVQRFLAPSDPNPASASLLPVPFLFNQTQLDSFAAVYESCTDDIVPNLAPGINTNCSIEQQNAFIDTNTTSLELYIISVDIDFSCEWTSRYTTVDYLPQYFLDYLAVTENLIVLSEDLRAAGIPVLEAFPPETVEDESSNPVDINTTAAPYSGNPPAPSEVPTEPPASVADSSTAKKERDLFSSAMFAAIFAFVGACAVVFVWLLLHCIIKLLVPATDKWRALHCMLNKLCPSFTRDDEKANTKSLRKMIKTEKKTVSYYYTNEGQLDGWCRGGICAVDQPKGPLSTRWKLWQRWTTFFEWRGSCTVFVSPNTNGKHRLSVSKFNSINLQRIFPISQRLGRIEWINPI